jgi:hypothetical protein
LAHHHEKISAHSYATLAESFVLLAARPWMPAELVALFARAQVLAAGNGFDFPAPADHSRPASAEDAHG